MLLQKENNFFKFTIANFQIQVIDFSVFSRKSLVFPVTRLSYSPWPGPISKLRTELNKILNSSNRWNTFCTINQRKFLSSVYMA